jgi:hypothetical protein
LVDRDDNLSLSGKNGVQVYIDGKPSPLTGKDLADYLRTLQSSSIESIEIITNPSARYDAAGNAGVINIRLKKNKSFGTNGSINAGYGISIHPRYNGGVSLNHRNSRVNVFGNYSYNRVINENFMNLHRVQLDTVFNQRSVMTWKGNSHNIKAGLDYFLNSKQTIGVMMNGNYSKNDLRTFSNTDISYQPTGEFVKKLTIQIFLPAIRTILTSTTGMPIQWAAHLTWMPITVCSASAPTRCSLTIILISRVHQSTHVYIIWCRQQISTFTQARQIMNRIIKTDDYLSAQKHRM